MSVSAAGTCIVFVVVGNTVGGLLSGYIVKATGRYKALTIVAACLGCSCYTLVLVRWRGHTGLAEALYVALGGLGMGITQSVTFVHLAASLEPEEMAIAGTSWFLSQSLGVLVSANMFNAVHEVSVTRLMEQALEGNSRKDEIIKGALSSIAYVWSLPEALRFSITQSYVDSLLFTNGLALAFGVISLLLACGLRERSLNT
ncbi:Uu.00g123420.m01.CDS01 [Anthostomella pinea]|uniref:Uu.00g123420.m01.CDS01 n=1 Tax=Anthostomella pinea TaxID=933095 RepID=A0AAI8YF34_9PEZI|nr:Uu.00g123420.m01.CDS01 [Anthostomella pinea]